MVNMDKGQQQPLGPGFDAANEAMTEAFDLEARATAELASYAANCGDVAATPTTEVAARSTPAGSAGTGGRVWPCPPDQRTIDEWRESARQLRETANASTSLVNKQGLEAQADQWDAMADDWLAYCAANPTA
jgi:hypothetical protein